MKELEKKAIKELKEVLEKVKDLDINQAYELLSKTHNARHFKDNELFDFDTDHATGTIVSRNNKLKLSSSFEVWHEDYFYTKVKDF